MAETGEVRHKFFARMYPQAAATADARGGAEHRRRLLAGLRGRVVEIGAGHGANFAHYPASVAEVVAVEPEPDLRAKASEAASSASVPVRVVAGTADALPVEDAGFDGAVFSLVLCTVPDQARALAEARRALRPGGELRFYEHVIDDKPVAARIERFLDATIWPRVAGGCHTARDTESAIRNAGFDVVDVDRFAFRPGALMPPVRHILGTARR
jgi:ubiquinone/menaquinone biosynthesis C-methylase UbiE